jgi:hypothetical protein
MDVLSQSTWTRTLKQSLLAALRHNSSVSGRLILRVLKISAGDYELQTPSGGLQEKL